VEEEEEKEEEEEEYKEENNNKNSNGKCVTTYFRYMQLVYPITPPGNVYISTGYTQNGYPIWISHQSPQTVTHLATLNVTSNVTQNPYPTWLPHMLPNTVNPLTVFVTLEGGCPT